MLVLLENPANTEPASFPLRRFLLHVLPKGLVRIRHFGLFANRTRSAMLALCRSLLGPCLASTPQPTQQLCPLCSGAMVLVERLTPYQLDLRLTRERPIRIEDSLLRKLAELLQEKDNIIVHNPPRVVEKEYTKPTHDGGPGR